MGGPYRDVCIHLLQLDQLRPELPWTLLGYEKDARND